MKERGLYVTLEKGGKIKRVLVNSKGEIKLDDTTINDELIDFAELDFQTYIDAFCEIERLSEEVEIEGEDHFGEVNMDTFHKVLTETNELVYDIEDKFDVLGTLLRLSLKDNTAADDGSAMYVYETKSKICDCIYEPIEICTLIRELLDFIAILSFLSVHLTLNIIMFLNPPILFKCVVLKIPLQLNTVFAL